MYVMSRHTTSLLYSHEFIGKYTYERMYFSVWKFGYSSSYIMCSDDFSQRRVTVNENWCMRIILRLTVKIRYNIFEPFIYRSSKFENSIKLRRRTRFRNLVSPKKNSPLFETRLNNTLLILPYIRDGKGFCMRNDRIPSNLILLKWIESRRLWNVIQ